MNGFIENYVGVIAVLVITALLIVIILFITR